jgi:hypothetical protein
MICPSTLIYSGEGVSVIDADGSLRYEGHGGRCCGAFLLSPSASQECKDWFSDQFAREYQVGVKELAPGTGKDRSVSKFI